MTEDLARTATRGASVTLVAQAVKLVFQVVSIVVLARLLTPSDYGLVAIVLVVVGFGELFRDFGLSTAAIQAKSLSVVQRDNLFWLNTVIGVVLTVIVFGISFPLGLWMHEPEVVGITQVLSVTFLVNALATQHRASLARALQFKKLAFLELVAAVVAPVLAIVCALLGFGYWALVVQQLASVGVLCVGVWIAAGWWPRWVKRAPMAGFVRFGWHLVASQVVNYAASNVSTMIIGAQFGAAALGLYNRAFQLIQVPLNQIRSPLTSVAVPVLSRAREDQATFDRMIVRSQLLLGYGVCTLLGLVAALPEPIIRLALGAQWMDGAVYLRFFAIGSVFQLLAFVGFWVYLSQGLTHILLRYNFVSAGIRIAAVLVGAIWGPQGIVFGLALASMVSWPISIWWLGRHTPIPTKLLYFGAGRVLVLLVVAAGAAMAVSGATTQLGNVWQPVIAATTYIAVCVIALSIPSYKQDFKGILALRRHLTSKKG